MIKFSIITVCLNAGDSLERTIMSVDKLINKEQVEHIIIDGVSTDNTLEVVARHQCFSRIFLQEKDNGLYDAMNKGAKIARGEYVGFLNAGDTFINEFVLKEYSYFLEAASFDVIYSDLLYLPLKMFFFSLNRNYISGELSLARLRRGFMPAHPTFYVRRSIFLNLGGFNCTYQIAADFDFMLRIVNVEGLNYIYHPSISVLMENGGVSNDGFGSKLKITNEMKRALENNGVKYSRVALFSRLMIKFLEYLK
jgi:glycosyltransferase involved in cell wall biosynthesis